MDKSQGFYIIDHIYNNNEYLYCFSDCFKNVSNNGTLRECFDPYTPGQGD